MSYSIKSQLRAYIIFIFFKQYKWNIHYLYLSSSPPPHKLPAVLILKLYKLKYHLTVIQMLLFWKMDKCDSALIFVAGHKNINPAIRRILNNAVTKHFHGWTADCPIVSLWLLRPFDNLAIFRFTLWFLIRVNATAETSLHVALFVIYRCCASLGLIRPPISINLHTAYTQLSTQISILLCTLLDEVQQSTPFLEGLLGYCG